VCCISKCIYCHQQNFWIDTLYVNYLIHVWPFSHHQVHTFITGYTTHPFTLVIVYNGYILCYSFDILRCNAFIYVLVKMLNIKIVKLLIFVECCLILTFVIIKVFYYRSKPTATNIIIHKTSCHPNTKYRPLACMINRINKYTISQKNKHMETNTIKYITSAK
jgi:hypothetical protein